MRRQLAGGEWERGGDAHVSLRPLYPADAPALRLLHQRLFPLDYDDCFYAAAVNRLDGVVSWAATLPLLTHVSVEADLWAPQLQPLPPPPPAVAPPEMLAGFITARAFHALYADPNDRRLLGLAGEAHDCARLLYVLTLGVDPAHQRRGLARRLLDTALRHAAGAACAAVYLHVAAFNEAAMAFYRRAGFRQLAVLPGFYTIKTGRQPMPGQTSYNAWLFGLRIAPPLPTPWDAANLALAPLTAAIGSLNACLPWGSQRRQQQQQQQQQHREPPDPEAPAGRPCFSRQAPGLQRPPSEQELHLSQFGSGNQPPDWLRSLFVRR